MSLAARCPRCESVFRLSEPQLAVARGWVRCGVCDHAFDAVLNLVERMEEAPAAPPFQPMPDIDLDLPDLGSLFTPEPAPEPAQAAGRSADSPVAAAPIGAAPSAPAPAELAPPPPVGPSAVEALYQPQTAAAQELALKEAPDSAQPEVRETAGVPASAEPATGTSAADSSTADATAAAPRATAPSPSFADTLAQTLAQSPEPASASPWSDTPPSGRKASATPARRGRSALLLVAAVLLLVLALAQTALLLRGALALQWPASRPWLQEACAVLGCRMPAVRDVQALSVEGSSLSHLDDGHHRLRMQLRNPTAAYALEAPAVELSLIDGQGQVMSRRVLLPTDWDTALSDLPPGGEAALSATLDLQALDAGAIATFRVLPFYP